MNGVPHSIIVGPGVQPLERPLVTIVEDPRGFRLWLYSIMVRAMSPAVRSPQPCAGRGTHKRRAPAGNIVQISLPRTYAVRVPRNEGFAAKRAAHGDGRPKGDPGPAETGPSSRPLPGENDHEDLTWSSRSDDKRRTGRRTTLVSAVTCPSAPSLIDIPFRAPSGKADISADSQLAVLHAVAAGLADGSMVVIGPWMVPPHPDRSPETWCLL